MLGLNLVSRISEIWPSETAVAARSQSQLQHLENRMSSVQGHLVQDDVAHSLPELIKRITPLWVINCIGIVKQSPAAESYSKCIEINSLLPHVLADACTAVNARLVHISTDCVFSGNVGDYRERDSPDACDLYGRSKALGEIDGRGHVMTIRTSIVGHGLHTKFGLIDWFLSEKGKVSGFTNAHFSGLTTNELASTIIKIVDGSLFLSGIVNIPGPKISKYDLLLAVRDVYNKDIQIDPVGFPRIDRSLNGERWEKFSGKSRKPWVDMLTDLYRWKRMQESIYNIAEC